MEPKHGIIIMRALSVWVPCNHLRINCIASYCPRNVASNNQHTPHTFRTVALDENGNALQAAVRCIHHKLGVVGEHEPTIAYGGVGAGQVQLVGRLPLQGTLEQLTPQIQHQVVPIW